jgi:quercetin dioxygenase-like cupin family protein
MLKPFTVTPENRPEPLHIVGEGITILASKDKTHGYEVFLQEGPAESGPPPHSHHWDETFIVTKGNVEFGYGDKNMVATTGTLVHLPAGTVHWFHFKEGGGQMISIAGHTGSASGFFTDLARAIPSGVPDIDKIRDVAKRHGINFQPDE